MNIIYKNSINQFIINKDNTLFYIKNRDNYKECCQFSLDFLFKSWSEQKSKLEKAISDFFGSPWSPKVMEDVKKAINRVIGENGFCHENPKKRYLLEVITQNGTYKGYLTNGSPLQYKAHLTRH